MLLGGLEGKGQHPTVCVRPLLKCECNILMGRNFLSTLILGLLGLSQSIRPVTCPTDAFSPPACTRMIDNGMV